MHHRLSVNTVGLGDRAIGGCLAELERHGIGRLGVPVAQLERGGRAANRAALAAGGFDVVDVVAAPAFSLTEPGRWPAERDRLRRCIDAAAAVGAEIFYTTTGPAAGLRWTEAARRFTDAVAPVVAWAASSGVTFAVENTVTMRADLSFTHRLADLLDLAAQAGVAVCADLFAAWTDRDLDEVIAASATGFSLVQIADFVLGTFATPDRAVPGDGAIAIERQLGALSASGYCGIVELELLGPRIMREGLGAAAARAGRIVDRWL